MDLTQLADRLPPAWFAKNIKPSIFCTMTRLWQRHEKQNDPTRQLVENPSCCFLYFVLCSISSKHVDPCKPHPISPTAIADIAAIHHGRSLADPDRHHVASWQYD
ncbi:MAG: hypothetical protein KUL75_07855 [Sterolibacterium sp.]|nr:hypothetical protein [Sterolibacterium sp.]